MKTKITETLVTFDTAKLAKEKDFDAECFGNYVAEEPSVNRNEVGASSVNWNRFSYYTSAPTQALLQKWLREVHLININITSSSLESFTLTITSHEDTKWNLSYEDMKFEDFEDYEEALEYGLQEALKLLPDTLPHS